MAKRPTSWCVAATVSKAGCFITCVPCSRQRTLGAGQPRGAAWCRKPRGGGVFRGRPRPKLKELDGPSPALAVVDEW
eukprot:2718867-Pleurochrysis_carterae.AAC.1